MKQKKVVSMDQAREEKTLDEMRAFLNTVMSQNNPDEAIPDEALDKWSDNIHEKLQQNKGGHLMEKMYTPEEVAEYFKRPLKTVEDWLRAKKLRGIKVGREWRILESELQIYMNELKAKRNGKQ